MPLNIVRVYPTKCDMRSQAMNREPHLLAVECNPELAAVDLNMMIPLPRRHMISEVRLPEQNPRL